MTADLEHRIAEMEARLAEMEAVRPGRATAWKVTAANGANWDVQAAYDDTDEVAGRTISDVAALAGQGVAVGDYVTVVWLADGTPRLFAGGGTASMIIAKEDMTADDTAYNCKHLEADGTEGSALTVRRPNGVQIDDGDTGFLGLDSSGQNVFIPCHARSDENLGLTLEVRTSDPSPAEAGRVWFRSDLG